MSSGSGVVAPKRIAEAKRGRSLPAKGSNKISGTWARDPSGNDAPVGKRMKSPMHNSSDSEAVNLGFPQHINLLEPVEKCRFEMDKMPKPLFVKGDYLWYADEKKIVYIVRPVEGTTPMFYHCIDLEGKKSLIAQNSLTLYLSGETCQIDGTALPRVDTSQEVILPTRENKMTYKAGVAYEEKIVIVLELLR